MSFLYRSLIISALAILTTGCVTRLNEPYQKVDGRYQIEDGRFKQDRTMSLKDISPVIDAYVKHPFPVCNQLELQEASKLGLLRADLTKPREERVYILAGGDKCVQ